MSSPTQRSKQWLEKRGWLVHVAEKWNHAIKRRIDAFGFVDLIALGPGGATLLVQTTTGDHLAARIAKAEALPVFRRIVTGGHEVHFHGWRRIGARGKRKLWSVRTVVFSRLGRIDVEIDDEAI